MPFTARAEIEFDESGRPLNIKGRGGPSTDLPVWSGDGVAAPGGFPAAAVGSAGALTGAYYYAHTYVTALGETAPSPGTAVAANPSAQRVNLSSIPLGPNGTVARRIYRTPANPADVKDYRFLVEIPDNISTTYQDNTPDGSLGAPVDWAATNRAEFREPGGGRFATFSDQSTGFGQGVFSANVGYASSAFGYQALFSNTSGRRNNAFGIYALTSLTTGYNNVGVGTHAGQYLTSGALNVFVGGSAGFNSNGVCSLNVAVGCEAMLGTASGLGQRNTAVGYRALADINTADDCIALGYAAGKYANASRMVFIDGQDRGSLANCQNIGLIYGKHEGTAAAQVLHLNAQVRIGAGNAPVVSGLPAASTAYRGFRGYVTDATAPYTSANVGTTVAGGGANVVPVFCTGAAWVIG